MNERDARKFLTDVFDQSPDALEHLGSIPLSSGCQVYVIVPPVKPDGDVKAFGALRDIELLDRFFLGRKLQIWLCDGVFRVPGGHVDGFNMNKFDV